MSPFTARYSLRPLVRIRPALLALPLGIVLASCSPKSADTMTDSGKAMPSGASTPAATASPSDTSMTGMAGMDHSKMGGMAGMTGNADQDFLRMMSDHHKGMIAMAHPTMDGKGSTATVRADARKIDAAQDAEIDQMVTMLEKDFKDPYQPKFTPGNQAMIDLLAKQTGTAYDRTFYMNVVKHHREALAMIDEYMPKLTRADLKAMAQKMKADQTREIAEFEKKGGGK